MTEFAHTGFKPEDIDDLAGRFDSIFQTNERVKAMSVPLRELPQSTTLGAMYRTLLIRRLSFFEQKSMGLSEWTVDLEVAIRDVERRICILESFQREVIIRLGAETCSDFEVLDRATQMQHSRIPENGDTENNKDITQFISETRAGFAELLADSV